MDRFLRITPTIAVPWSEIHYRFSRSRGPGGQNVNKVSTRVDLLFDLQSSSGLGTSQKERVAQRLKSLINDDGFLVLSSQESRSQWRNRQDVTRKFVEILSSALHVAAPRVATKATRLSRERRLKKKALDARKKEGRRRILE